MKRQAGTTKARRRVVIIGGGAAGLTAAIAAARAGARVQVLERMQRVGKKILATGNGRCNFSNTDLGVEHYHGADPRFVLPAIRAFGLDETLAFFRELGVVPHVEERGRIFPASGQASAILDVLRHELEHLGVETLCEMNVERIVRDPSGLRVLCGDGRAFPCDRAIVAAGGKSTPNLGSNGGGFRVAQALGHRIEPPFPALVPVKLDAPFLKQLQGVRFEGEAQVFLDGEPVRAERGEILFTEQGVSGVPVLQISRVVSEWAESGRELSLGLRPFPDSTPEALASTIAGRVATFPWKPVEASFIGWLNKRLIPVLLKEAGICDLQRPCGELSGKEIQRVAALLHLWRIPCAGVQSWMQSQVTAGGVSTREIDPETLESKRAPGVFFAGEVLDIDGDSGGYNLQWAWSSGHVAGRLAAVA
ncbi:MAG: NAD(P)/FAD-dependent oxidoreductase [Armatimonadetes bacterium]|nr:NAD(P)/FAD-dependent oxidoreductase [Armatimonadota bacterium]HOM82302.1 NAD(P)/FAD-dependent oxidoreductase [Armatimonadota bacterium]HOQ27425.1 NAD(P)/FAD-dependent oxidoreductase [Armatimonadota bacterium]HPO71130.1 NAD(P)/FAD-dependent oxidoreductase [Armatimonadota bacterium]